MRLQLRLRCRITISWIKANPVMFDVNSFGGQVVFTDSYNRVWVLDMRRYCYCRCYNILYPSNVQVRSVVIHLILSVSFLGNYV